METTVKPLYGRQEGAVVGDNPRKPGRPSHTCHTYAIAELRLMLEVEVPAGNQHASTHSAPGLWALLARIGREAWPAGARRLRLGNRGEHEPGGTGGICPTCSSCS